MKKKYLLFAIILMLSCGCVENAKQSVQKENFTIDFLFEINGCKMYRFKDGGDFIYWSDCEGRVEYDYRTQSGKTIITHKVQSMTSK